MTFAELMVEQQAQRIRKLDSAWIAFEEEARRMQPHGGLRHGIANAFVRLGGWLDRDSLPRERTTLEHTWY